MAWQDLFTGNQPGLSDDDKTQLANSGLLSAGLSVLANNRSPGTTPMQALSGGLLGGIQSAQQGGQKLVNQRQQQAQQQFQQAQMADAQQQMQRRQALQDLSLKHVITNPDGTKTFDQQGYMQDLMQQDPQAGLELQQNQLKTQIEQQQVQQGNDSLNNRDITQGLNTLHQTRKDPNSPWTTEGAAPRFAPQQDPAAGIRAKIALARQNGATDTDIKSILGIDTGAGDKVASFDPAGPTGTQFISSLNPDMQKVVQGVVDGRVQPPAGTALKDPYWKSVLNAAAQADPNFDATDYQARAKAHADFTSGKTAQTITALNTAAHHLDLLQSQVAALNNGKIPAWNSVANSFATGTGGASVNNYNLSADAVADELTKVLAGSSGALGDREQLRSRLAANQSPDQQAGVAKTAADLIHGKLAGLQSQANQGLGLGSKAVQIISPQAQALFDKYSSDPSSTAAPSTGGWSVKKVN